MYVSETWDKFTEFVLWKFEIFQVKWEKGIVKFEKKNEQGYFITNSTKLNMWFLANDTS